MEISVIIPVHHGGDGIQRLLDSIEAQLESPEREVILVVNPPDHNLRKAIVGRARVRYLETTVIGANHARNLGINVASGKILLFVDDDCLMQDRKFLRRHWQAHELHGEIAGIGGPYTIDGRASLVAKAYHILQTNWIRESPQPGYRADLLLGGNMSFKRETFEKEKFDPVLAFGGTETELIFRLAARGLRTRLLDDLYIQHDFQDGFINFLLKAVRQGCGAIFLKRRNYHGVPLVTKGGQVAGFMPSPAICLVMSLYRSFFRAGYAKGNFSGRYLKFQMFFAGAWTAGKDPFRRLHYLFFVEVWGLLRSAILLRKLGLVENGRGERDHRHRS